MNDRVEEIYSVVKKYDINRKQKQTVREYYTRTYNQPWEQIKKHWEKYNRSFDENRIKEFWYCGYCLEMRYDNKDENIKKDLAIVKWMIKHHFNLFNLCCLNFEEIKPIYGINIIKNDKFDYSDLYNLAEKYNLCVGDDTTFKYC